MKKAVVNLLWVLLVIAVLATAGIIWWLWPSSETNKPQATAKTTSQAIPTEECRELQPVIKQPVPAPPPPVAVQPPTIVNVYYSPPAPVATQQPQVTQPAPVQTEPKVVAPVTVEKPVYENILIVDSVSGVPQFEVYEKVLRSSIRRNGNVTEFSCKDNKVITSARVLESDSYTDGYVPRTGCLYVPSISAPVEQNLSQLDIYHDGCGMYCKSSGSYRAIPANATWDTQHISSN